MGYSGNKALRDILDLPLTPEVAGMVRIWVDADSAAARQPSDVMSPALSPRAMSTLRRHVVLQLSATPSRTLFDAVARLGICRSQGAQSLDHAEVEELADGALEDLIQLARDCAAGRRRRIDLPE